MKREIKISIPALVLMFLVAATTKQTNNLCKVDWLIGTWENVTPQGIIYEEWNQTSDHSFSGKSYHLMDEDTLIFETLKIVEEEQGIFYIPVVKNQNEGLPVCFTSKTISATQMVFENPQHDFPQIISYTKISTDSLVAVISGTKNGQVRQQSFPMKRTKRKASQ